MTDHIDRTFTSADMRVAMFAEDTFTNCVFQGEAFKCNFAGAVFTNCTFDEGFQFVGCNCHGVDGIPDEHFDNRTARSSKADYDEKKAEIEAYHQALERGERPEFPGQGRGRRP